SPKHSSNSTPSGPVICAIPDRSSSRSRSAKSAMNPTSHTAATDLPASAAARAGLGRWLARGLERRSGGGAGAQPAQRDRAADPIAGPKAGLVSLGVPGQCLDPAALPVPAAGQLQQRRGPVGRPAESRQRGPQLLGALIVPAEPAQRQAQPQPHLRVAARGGPLVEQQRVVVGQLIAQRPREPQREGGIRDGEQGRQLGRQPGAGAGSGSERRQRDGRAVRAATAAAAIARVSRWRSSRSRAGRVCALSAVAARSAAGTTTRPPTVSTSPSAASLVTAARATGRDTPASAATEPSAA